ncbi:calcium/calmodulin dependent protein kinase [Aspergillus costaricaensis CBS 115574]|uniref:Calcium/calmodulin dependent protein kinase n=1 Tax=Aspergillus costaricaensis CBS 115574 TaxID=1448317 RepID=A0ACD1I1Q4_9EURO|nr:calcium/calmodulin dependent protein kinase [Aspergillus costaricaensis CBS 115574]RAK83920.1 calcium/calmodulin dependent protein kinase [Aspergillus costaricaensis CBS 115574]
MLSLCSPIVHSFKTRAHSALVSPRLLSYRSIISSRLHRRASTIPTSSIHADEYIGQSGRNYKVERILQEEASPPRQVLLATAGDERFILKYIHEVNFEDLQDVNSRLRNDASHVRLAQDIIPEKSMYVFEYLTGHLLHLAQKDLSLETRKRLLKEALLGIAEMHEKDVVHTDIKADNFFVNWKQSDNGITIEKVQLGDLEDAVYIPPGSSMLGKQAGNWMWRSPEAHARGRVNKPSDIFSFALVCIYVVHKRVIFAVGDDELDEGIDRLAIVIERQISYFADKDGFHGFLEYLGDNPWASVFNITLSGFNQDNPVRPFSLWQGVDDDFKSLICAMTNLDPKRRITARQALAHSWFDGV